MVDDGHNDVPDHAAPSRVVLFLDVLFLDVLAAPFPGALAVRFPGAPAPSLWQPRYQNYHDLILLQRAQMHLRLGHFEMEQGVASTGSPSHLPWFPLNQG